MASAAGRKRTTSLAVFLDLSNTEVEHVLAAKLYFGVENKLLGQEERIFDAVCMGVHSGKNAQLDRLQRSWQLSAIAVGGLTSGGLAPEFKVIAFDLGGVGDAREDCKVGPHAEEVPDMDWRELEERTENVSGCCRGLTRLRKPSGSAMWCLTCPSRSAADAVWLTGGDFNVDIRSIQGTMINIHLCVLSKEYLSGDATPMLVAKGRRTGMAVALPVERKGAADQHAVGKLEAWVDVLGSTQVTTRSDGEPSVMHAAAAVRFARRAGSVTTLDTSAPG